MAVVDGARLIDGPQQGIVSRQRRVLSRLRRH